MLVCSSFYFRFLPLVHLTYCHVVAWLPVSCLCCPPVLQLLFILFPHRFFYETCSTSSWFCHMHGQSSSVSGAFMDKRYDRWCTIYVRRFIGLRSDLSIHFIFILLHTGMESIVCMDLSWSGCYGMSMKIRKHGNRELGNYSESNMCASREFLVLEDHTDLP